jgi:glycosyltransferase involved in cell wall biosynthesis
MKVVYFTESLYPLVDGVSRTLARLFASLLREEVDFRVVSPFLPDRSIPWASRVIPVRYAHFPPYPDYRVSRPGGRSLRAELNRFAPDLLHMASPTPMAIWAQRFARQQGIPAVASFHTHFVSYFRYYGVSAMEGAGWAALRWFYRRCARVYAPSWSIIRELEGHGIANVELWSRGIDLEAFQPGFRDEALRQRVGAGRGIPILLLVSRLVKEKDLADLVAIGRVLRGRGVEFRLALVGDGPMRSELESALPDAYFAGHQSGEELARWYASADVFIFPSTTETLGNVVLEALASGIPAVVVDRGGPQDLVDEGENGFIAPANDVAAIADRLEPLLRQPELRERMGRAARESALDRDWDRINRGLLDSYRGLIGEMGSPAVASGTNG